MQTVQLEEAQCHLAELVAGLGTDGEIVIVRGEQAVARLVAPAAKTGDARAWIGYAARLREEAPRRTDDWLAELRAGER